MRDRLTLPLLLPMLAAGLIFLTIFSFGHLLLRVQETRQAWPVAIVVAAWILLVATIIATRPTAPGPPIYIITALPAAVILAIGMFYLFRAPEGRPTEGGAAVAAIPPPGPLSQIATDNKFSQTSFTIVAGQQYTLTFTNQGQALHNWHLKGVTDAGGQEVATKLLPGGQSESITFTVPQPGTYQFLCDVHPVEMVGQLTAVAGGGAAPAVAAAGGGSAGPGSITVIATDNKFSLTQLNANANERTSLTLQNRGTAIHNWHLLNVKNPDGSEIMTKLLPGGQSETIQFTVAQPGTYDFRCDVHPVEMVGKLTVK